MFLLLVCTPVVEATDDAQDSELGGVTETGVSADGTNIETEASREGTVPPAEPVVSATIVEDAGSSVPADQAAVGEGPPPVSAPCVEYGPQEYNADLDIYYTAPCIKWETCGAERVDDTISGEINGEPAGHYASFIAETIVVLDEGDFVNNPGYSDVNSVHNLLVENGLADEDRDPALIPVFYYCAERDDVGVVANYDLTSVSFGWDLQAEEIYDVPGILADLFEKLKARITLYDPQIGLVPDAETGITIVQFPTWLFMENLQPEEAVYTTNDTDTFRVDLRAQMTRLDWFFGEVRIRSCAPGEIRVFDPERHHVIEDLPECHHTFTQLGVEDLSVTIVYEVQEAVRTAPSTGAYAPIQWVDYSGPETMIELSSTFPDYHVRAIYSVNVAMDADIEEVQAAYRESLSAGE